jgi:multiple antibiotic resistance protein
MLVHSDYLKTFIGLLAIVNPIGAIPIFISLTTGMDDTQRLKVVHTVAIAVGIILLTALFIGEALLGFFGITINSFRVGGGILILLMSVSMMHAKISAVIQTKQESEESLDRDSVAIVPLSIPLLAGPGAISTVILDAHKAVGFVHYTVIALEIVLLSLILWVVLRLSPIIARRITATGINIVTRIMGLILAAIAVEFIAVGLKGLFPTLAS